jgi:large subunit ribosomal protein L11
MEFCKAFNEKTAKEQGMIIPVILTVYKDRSFSFITKTPPAAVLIKKALNLEKGSSEPNKEKVGELSRKQVEEIARIKLKDLNARNLESAVKIIEGTAKSMGIKVGS